MEQNITYDMLARQEDTGRMFGLILSGGPGIGKTAAAMAMVREGDVLCRLACAGKSKDDFVTYPVPEKIVLEGREGEDINATSSVWYINQPITESMLIPLLEQNIGDGYGMVLLDDVTGAQDENLQTSMLELVQFGRVGPHQLGKNVAVVMTGNQTTDGAFAIDWSTALMGRSHVVEYKANLPRWLELPMNKNLDPVVVGFLKQYEDFFAPDRGNSLLYDKCFALNKQGPAPRLWSALGNSLVTKWGGIQNFEGNILFPTAQDYVKSFMGDRTTSAFFTFADMLMKYPTAQQMFEEPEKWDALTVAQKNHKGCSYAVAHSVRHYCLQLNEKINEKYNGKFTKEAIAEKEKVVLKFCYAVAKLMQQDQELGAYCIRYVAMKLAHNPKETFIGQLAGYGWGLPGVDPVLVDADFPDVMKKIKEVSALMDKGNAPSR